MAVIASIDGPNRRIYLHSDTIGANVHPIDIYIAMRTFRRTDESLRKYDTFLTAYGNVEKGGGKYTERYVQCMSGTRIVPYDTTQELTITGTIITDDGQEGIACFDRAPLTSTTVVDINYVPPQVEVIVVETGSGLSTEEHDKLITGLDTSIPPAVWDEAEAEITKKMLYNKVTKSGDIVTIYEDDESTVWKQFDLSDDGRVEV